ncbi:MAG: universal stress protein [Planctomycetes bacterium]|nr:universal stress protein [Planctomycetota bacterium]
MFTRILVPLDGSPLSEAILPAVESVAALFGAEILLLRVVPPAPDLGMEARYADSMVAGECERYLAEAAGRMTARGRRVSVLVRTGAPAQGIAEEAPRAGADLIAMSTHGRSGVSRWVFGSVTEKVIRLASVPLLLVRPPLRPCGSPDQRPFSRILVPLDGSALAESIFAQVEELVRKCAAEVHLLRVEEVEEAASHVKGSIAATRVHVAEEYLRHMTERSIAKGFTTLGAIRCGNSADGILRYSEERVCDLIAMSTHGRSGVSRLLLGSVADKVLRASQIPILLLRGRE